MRKIIRYASPLGPRWGVVEGQRVLELEGNPYEAPRTGPEVGMLEGVTLLPPVTPTKILCVGRNYPAHAAEHDAVVPTEPLLFLKPPSALIGPGASILIPPQSERVDYEAELAVVIGRRCRDVSPAAAWEVVLGVTCANDVTARDLQRQDSQWTRAKGFDTFCPVGPWLVTGVAELELFDRAVRCRVNGEIRQADRIGSMAFSPAELIAYASSVMTLEPGDLLLTGTPAGVGPLHPGDIVEVEVEGIGLLRNPVREYEPA